MTTPAPPPPPKARRREEALSCDIQLLEASLREQDLEKEPETPAQEIARLKGAPQQPEAAAPDREVGGQQNVHAKPTYTLKY